MINGDVAVIKSCYSKSEKMILEVDIFNHSAWQENKQFVNDSVGNVAKFKQKYGLSADLFKKEDKNNK
jgi:ribosomal protein L31